MPSLTRFRRASQDSQFAGLSFRACCRIQRLTHFLSVTAYLFGKDDAHVGLPCSVGRSSGAHGGWCARNLRNEWDRGSAMPCSVTVVSTATPWSSFTSTPGGVRSLGLCWWTVEQLSALSRLLCSAPFRRCSNPIIAICPLSATHMVKPSPPILVPLPLTSALNPQSHPSPYLVASAHRILIVFRFIYAVFLSC